MLIDVGSMFINLPKLLVSYASHTGPTRYLKKASSHTTTEQFLGKKEKPMMLSQFPYVSMAS